MADSGGRWTEADRASLIGQIIQQLKPEKGGINWDKIQVGTRTRKACQNTWFTYLQTLKQSSSNGDGESTTPSKAGTKRKVAKNENDQDIGDGGFTPTPKKRGCGKRIKTETHDDGNGDTTPKKGRGRPQGAGKRVTEGGPADDSSAPQTPMKIKEEPRSAAVVKEAMDGELPREVDDDGYEPTD